MREARERRHVYGAGAQTKVLRWMMAAGGQCGWGQVSLS